MERDEELSDKEGPEPPWTQPGDRQEPPRAADEAPGDESPIEAVPGGCQEEVAVPGGFPFVKKEALTPWTKAPCSTPDLDSTRNGCAWSDGSHGEKQSEPAGGSGAVGKASCKIGASGDIPDSCRGTGNMLGSKELGAEVGGGGWSFSACPGGADESGEPWGVDLEWEGWAGRWEVLERDRQTQTELGTVEMWE